MYVNWQMDKQNGVYLYNGMFIGSKNDTCFDTCYNINIMLSEKSPSQNIIYCMISFI